MTLAEMKQRMSVREIALWQRYEAENGPLHSSIRIEAAIARAVAPFMGKKVTPQDFMPWPVRDAEDEREAAPEDLLSLLSGLSRG